jgi:5-formyltetrahydrofolate cyclo-ligase
MDGVPTADELVLAKRRCRTAALELRAQAHARSAEIAPARLQAFGLDFLAPPPGLAVSGFMPFRDEINALPLLTRLAAEGWRTAMPVVVGPGLPLVFRAWAPGDPTVPGAWSIPVPTEDAPGIEPDVLLVPMLAFDKSGHRLGYGGGYYDRSVARLRAVKPVLAIGVAYAAQELGDIPVAPYDQPLDWILTEEGPLRPLRPQPAACG